MKNMLKKAVLAGVCFAAGLAAGCRAIGIEDKNDPFDETAPLIKGFPLSAHNAVLFKDQGPLTVSAQVDPDIAGAVTISWEITEGSGVITIDADGEHATITPAAKGAATLAAKLTPKEGFIFDEESQLVSECRVTVLEGFAVKPSNSALNPGKLLFFVGETETRSVEVDLDIQALSELSRVAAIAWTVEGGSAAAVPAESAGADTAVTAGSAGQATLRATLSAKNAGASGSAGDFNGAGVSAILAIDTLALPALTIDDPGTIMLNADNTEKSLDIKLNYPPALFNYGPAVAWSSTDAAKASVPSAGTVASGSAQTALAAKAPGTATIKAALTVEGREFSASQAVTVVNYVAPNYPVEKITLDGVSAGSTLTLVQTDSSAVITATAGRTSDANQPSNKKILWSALPQGYVDIVDGATPNTDGMKIKIKALAATPSGDVTITAKSDSNNNVTAAFKVKVNALVVTITPDPASFTYNTGVTLSATTNAANKAVTWSAAGTNSGLAVIGSGASPVIKTNAPVTASTALSIKAAAAAATTISAERTVTVLPHKFKITFNANYTGGPGETAAVEVTYGSSTKLTKNTFTRTSYVFDGWTAAQDGSGTLILDEAAVSLLNGNDAAKVPGGELKLYAKWTTTQYTVKYNINGGGVGQGGTASPYAETDWVRGTAKALKTAAALKWTKTSGFFRGWDTNIAGTTVVYSDGQSVSNLAAAGGTINLYAVWGVSATMPPMGVPSAPESSVYAVAAAAGAYHSFVLRSDGTLWAAGRNQAGQLGIGNTTNKNKFTKVGGGTGLLGGKKVIAVDGGSVHSLAVTEDGAVWATGSNAEGALGINSTSNKTSFTKTNITSGAIAVVAATDNYDGGKSSSYVLKSDGSVWAAGLNSNGQLGTETLDDKKSFVQVIPRGATAIAASYYTAFALVDGSVYGTGNIKHLGFATDSSAWRELGLLATAIAGNKMIANVLAVSSGLFAVRGANPYGEFGLGNTTTQTDWTSTGKTPDYMGAGYYHTFYLSGGALYTTGGNSFGQLGRNGVTGSLVFGVSTGQGGSNVVAAAGGGFHTLILKNNGKVYGRGANSYGQIGMGIDVNWPDTWDAVNYDE